MTTPPSCIDDCDVLPQPATTIQEEREEYERPVKKFCSVSVQTCPRLSGPSDREMELQYKVKILQDRLRYKEKRMKSVQDLVIHLKEAGKCSDTLEDTFLKTFSEFDLELFKNQAYNNKVAKSRKKYTSEMKKFASTLYFYSPRAYEFVRAKISLPHTATLRRWLQDYVIDFGFITNVFEFLKTERVDKEYLKDVALIFDSMAIRKQVVFDTKSDRCRGFVDYGNISKELDSQPNSDKLATEALVFQIVSYRDKFKCPIANFAIAGCPAEIQAQLLLIAIKKLYDVGVIVRSITCDGCSVNESTLKRLGCNFDPNNLKTHFKHPDNNSNIHVIIDPCHLIKLCRNAFGEITLLSNTGDIRFSYVEQLHKIQEAEGFKLANRLSTTHVFYKRKKMEVSLAAQTVSSGVADAIDFLRCTGHEKFSGSEATCEFLRFFDRLFDMLNTRNAFGKGFKAPLSLCDAKVWEEVFEQCEQYIRSLKVENISILKHKRKMFALGFLINIQSFKNLAYDLLTKIETPLKYFLTYKCSQDHIELHFCCIRSRGGWNNNPNVLQFLWSTRRLLSRNSVDTSRNGNCIADDYEQTSILEFRSSKRDNEHCQISENIDEDTQLEELMVSLENSELSNFQQNILYYITDTIIRKFLNRCDCSHCRDILLNDGDKDKNHDHDYTIDVNRYAAFTTFIDRGNLYHPSRAAFEIIKFSERMFKSEIIAAFKGKENSKKRIIAAAVSHFLPFINELFHPTHPIVATDGWEDIHEIKLIKHLTATYATLRIHTYLKNKTLEYVGAPSTMRQHLHNSILFYHV